MAKWYAERWAENAEMVCRDQLVTSLYYFIQTSFSGLKPLQTFLLLLTILSSISHYSYLLPAP
jgi:hypothetical protein